MKKTKIQSVEEAVSVYEESSIIRGTATMNGDAKTNNKYVPVQNRALVYLYEHDSLAALHPLLLVFASPFIVAVPLMIELSS